MPDRNRRPDSGPRGGEAAPGSKEEALARIIREDPERAAQLLREILNGNLGKK